jgi:hypothetical protein
MAAVTATRFNPILAPFYRRLRDAGKPAKVAVAATMRELAQGTAGGADNAIETAARR